MGFEERERAQSPEAHRRKAHNSLLNLIEQPDGGCEIRAKPLSDSVTNTKPEFKAIS